MTTKENFKKFVSSRPHLAKYVNDGKMTWQKFYEMYDLYGEDSSVWDEYQVKEESVNGLNKFNDLIKNVDMKSVKEHIGTAQKALDFVQELTSKGSSGVAKAIATPRPINKFFED